VARSLLADAFDHHVWATQRLIEACTELTPEQLEMVVPGTYGSIIETMRHLVGADAWYLVDITGDRSHGVEAEAMDLRELLVVIGADGKVWSDLLGRDPDPDRNVHEVDETDGFERDAPVGVRLAQTLHHGDEHRTQISTAITTLGVEPPSLEVWDFALETGRSVERMPTEP
jgi:uncharacterized damage-inducible protein DinB